MSRGQVPPHLYRRYGIPERKPVASRLLLAGLIGVLVVGFIAIARSQGPGEQVRLVSWQANAEGAEVRWFVLRYDDAPVYCVLRAQDEDRFDVGFAVVRVKGTAAGTVFTSRLLTRGEVFTVDTPACSLEPARLQRPHFRPGVLSPAQQAPLFAPWQPVADWLQG